MKFLTLAFGVALMMASQLASAHTTGSAGKNAGDVQVSTAAPVQGAPGSPVNVQLDFTGLPSAGNVAVTYATESGLTLTGAAKTQLNPDSRGTAQDTVVVKAASAGVYFLNVFARSGSVTRAVSIPVTIGAVVAKPRVSTAVSTPGGQRVIEMPAQQTTH